MLDWHVYSGSYTGVYICEIYWALSLLIGAFYFKNTSTHSQTEMSYEKLWQSKEWTKLKDLLCHILRFTINL